MLSKLKKSFIGRWEFSKHKMFKPFANLLTREYYHRDLLFESGKIFNLKDWVFHDENWIRVQNRHKHRRLLAEGKSLNITDNWQEPTMEVTASIEGCLDINTQTIPDKWIYLYIDPLLYSWDNYSWNFTVCRHTNFRELQFGFRYQDFYNRYRYRFEADHIFFDKVIRGRCFHALNAIPFQMKLGIFYDVRIEVWRNLFKCFVNGKLMSRDYDLDNRFPRGTIALILWEKNGHTNIRATIGAMQIHRLVVNNRKH